MDIDPTLQNLVAELGDHLGLNGLSLDEEGFTALRFDDSLVLNLQAVTDGDMLMFYADLGPPLGGTAFYATLLRANLFWRTTLGSTLSLSADDPAHVVLAREIAWRGLSLGELVEHLERFINTAEDWADLVQSEPDEAQSRLADQLPLGGNLGMMRV